MSELDDLLAQASSPGEGRFTLDPLKAREKLARYQLADPHCYILKLVQWAVASGAANVWVDVRGDEVCVSHDGDALWETPHLEAGLAAAYRLGAGQISMESDERVRVTLRGLKVQQSLGPLWGALRPVVGGMVALGAGTVIWGAWAHLMFGIVWGILYGTQLANQLIEDDALGFLTESRLLLRGDYALARFGCHYAPVPVYLNGRPMNRPWFGCGPAAEPVPEGVRTFVPAETLRRCYLLGPGGDLPAYPGGVAQFVSAHGAWSDVNRLLTGDELTRLLPEGVRWLPRVCLGGEPALGSLAMLRVSPATGKGGPQPGKFIWVKDGVILKTEASHLPGVTAVISAHGLSADLSQFQLVIDDAYRDRVDEVIRAAQWLA